LDEITNQHILTLTGNTFSDSQGSKKDHLFKGQKTNLCLEELLTYNAINALMTWWF